MTTPEMTVAQRTLHQVRALGTTFDADTVAATRAIYRPVLDLSSASTEREDVVYGPHARHRLDIYEPASRARAVVIFIHGGGFVAGDKNGDGIFYRNIGRWLARQGWVAVLPNYRLAPECAWPAGAQDIQRVTQWVSENRGGLGSADLPVVLWGQSAGASHVASWLFDDQARGGDAVNLAAVMLMSGFYNAQSPLPAGPKSYFGEDASLYAQRSPLTHVRDPGLPVWLGVAELDPGWIGQQTFALAQALTLAQGKSPDFHFFRGHNHVSTVQSLGSPQRDAGDEVLRFLEDVTKR